MIWLIIILPFVAFGAVALALRHRVAKVQQVELARVAFAVAELEELLQTRRDCLPELVNICRVFTDYQRATLVRLRELHSSLLQDPPIADRIVLENAVSEFLRDLVDQIGTYPQLEQNVFLQQLLQKVYEAEARIADRRSRVNLRVDEYNQTIQSGSLAKFATRFGLEPLRRLDMTAQELLQATSPFGAEDASSELPYVSEVDAAPSPRSNARELPGDDEFDLSDDVDEFGGELEDVPKATPTTYAAAADASDIESDDLRMVEVDDSDPFDD